MLECSINHCYCFNSYQRLLDVSLNRILIAIQCLLLFESSVLGGAHRVLTQIQLFSHDVPQQTGRFF